MAITEKKYEISKEKSDELIELRKKVKYFNGFITGISEKEYKIKRKIREILDA
jgi:transcription termination factor NusB